MEQVGKISFNECVKTWSYERFIATFSPVYPLAALESAAKDLGLTKPKPASKVDKK